MSHAQKSKSTALKKEKNLWPCSASTTIKDNDFLFAGITVDWKVKTDRKS